MTAPALEDLLIAGATPSADLHARLQWLEDAAAAAEAADLGDDGRVGALHLRAALGAIVQWTRGPQDPATLVELDAVVRLLIARGTLALYRALAAAYAALVDARAPHRAACVEAKDAYLALARAVEKGTPVGDDVVDRLTRIRATLS